MSLLAVVVLLLGLIWVPQATAADSSVSLDKTVSKDSAAPGEEFYYSLTLSCSGLTTDCIDATLTDTLPAGLDVVSLPQDSPDQTVTYDEGTRLLTVKYVIPLASPPNPEGSLGLPAGATRKVSVSMRVPTETDLADGTVLTNDASFSGSNTNTANDSADITITVPRAVRPVATKDWTPSSAVAQSGAESTLTLGVRNASSSSAEVTELALTDVDSDTFEKFDVTSVGPVVYPPGADQVTIEYCTQLSSACEPFDAIQGPLTAPETDGQITPPAGVDLADVTGFRFTFSSSAGQTLPYSADQGTVQVGLVLRDTIRSTGEDYLPLERDAVTNTVTPSALDEVQGLIIGDPASDRYDVNPNIAKVQASKEFCADDNADFTCSGDPAVADQGSGVSMNLSATNASGFPVAEMTITEPDPSVPAAVAAFRAVDLTSLRYRAPSQTETTTVTVDCRDGSTHSETYDTAPESQGQTLDVTPTFCPEGVYPSSVTITYTGTGGQPTIADRATGTLDLTGTLNGRADPGDLENCASTTVSNGTNSGGSATANACDTTPVQEPEEGGGGDGGDKTTGDINTIVPGQELEFTLSYTNFGNLPLNNVVLVDPIDPATDPAPFDIVRLTSLTAVSTDPPSTLEVWDPDTAAGAGGYVAYDAADAALLERALGIRVSVDGELAPNQKFTVKYTVLLRDGVADDGSVSFENCAGVGTDLTDPFCNDSEITVELGQASGSVNKRFEPAELVRPWPGQDPAAVPTADLKLAVSNNGNLYLSKIVATDVDADFFDAYDFRGNVRVNYPPGADRVQLDVCTTAADCATGTFTEGSLVDDTTPDLPSGVSAADVVGFRVTFTRQDGAYLLTPGENFNGACPGASICVQVAPRADLRSDPGTEIPDSVENTATADGKSLQQDPDDPDATFPFGDAPATIEVVTGDASMGITKTPDSRIAPGQSAPFYLTIENTGQSAIPDLLVEDVLPEELFLEDITGQPTGTQYLITYAVPSGTPEPTQVDYVATPDPEDPNRVAQATWSFPGWDFLPGAKVVIQLQAELAPGTPASVRITNDARTTSGQEDFEFTCSYDGQETITGQLWCTSEAEVTSLEGTSFDANKWSAGLDDLGFYNTLTERVYPTADPRCPRLVVEDRAYTRYPCVALNYPGQGFDFLLRLTNASNNALSRSVELIDTLPVLGDRGIILNEQQRETQWSTPPRLLSEARELTNYGLGVPQYSEFDTVAQDICFPLSGGGVVPDGCVDADWTARFPADRDQITAARGQLFFPRGLLPGDSALVTFRVDSPLVLDEPGEVPVAWNSFAHEDYLRLDSGTAEVLPATEPIKAGIAVLYGRVAVEKVVTGTPPVGADLPPFPVQYECTATQEQPGGVQGPVEVVASGTVDVTAAEPVEVPDLLPAGATCKFWETDTNGGISDSDSKDTAQEIVVEPTLTAGGEEPAPAQVVRITNDYPLGSLELTKAVTGTGAAFADKPFVFDVACTFEGAEILNEQVTLTAPDDLTAMVEDINVGALCTITEQEPYGGADGPATFSPEGPYVISGADTGPVTVTATNVFTAGQLVIEKVVENAEPGIGPFTFQATCVAEDGSPVELPDGGKVELYGGEQVSADVPMGSTCTVTEVDVPDGIEVVVEDSDPDTEGGASDGVVVIDGDASVGVVTVTNVFPDGLLVIEKVVENAEPDAGPFTFEVTCVAADGTPVELPEGGRVQLSGGEQAGAPVPPGSTCTVVETGVPDDVIVSIEDSDPSTAGGATDGVVVIAESASVQYVTVTNTFPSGELPKTGADGAMQWLLFGLGLILSGAVLTTLSRRRRAG